jgi:S-layer like family, C-terminal region
MVIGDRYKTFYRKKTSYIMRKKTIISDGNGKTISKKIMMFDNITDIKILSNNIAWKIIELLSSKAMYPAQVAKELKLYDQTVYYYIRKLAKIGAIEQVGTRLIRGGTARLYSTSSPSFGLELEGKGEKLESSNYTKDEKRKNIPHILKEFYENNSFSGLIVVGAPDPHGPYKSSSRDGHYAVHLSFYLGTLSESYTSGFIVKLDVDAKAEKDIDNRNLILIGGPGTNIVTSEFNRYLQIKFNEDNYWSGLTDQSGRIFNMDNHGLIAKISNPYNKDKKILILAGVRSIGTKASVIALTNYGNKISDNSSSNNQLALVVQGFDMNADGKIDHVDIVS